MSATHLREATILGSSLLLRWSSIAFVAFRRGRFWRETGAQRCLLLPACNTAHIRKMMRDTLMAIDASLFAGEQEALVGD